MKVPSVEDIVKDRGLEIMADAELDREGWLEARKQVVTASDVAAIVGAVPGMTKRWYQRKGWIEREAFTAQSEEAMDMGHRSENFNAELFRAKTGRLTLGCQKLIRNPRYPWLAVTPDFFQFSEDYAKTGTFGVLETKSTGRKDYWPEGDDEEPSINWQLQLQAQLKVLDAGMGSLSAIIGSPYLHHRWRDFDAHDGSQEIILTRTKLFLDSLNGDEPPWDEESESAADAMRQLTLEYLSGDTIQLCEEAIEWTDELEKLEASLSTLERRKKELRDKIVLSMGTAIRGILPNGDEWSFKPQVRAEHIVKASTSRILRVKRKSERKK